MELSLLSIEAAEELQRLKLKKITDLRNTKELSTLIKEDFVWKWDYSKIFSEAYFATYSEELSLFPSKKSKNCMNEISKKLESPSNLKYKELKQLIDFCVNLSDYSSFHDEEIRILKSGGYF
jgi:hypothetical protein